MAISYANRSLVIISGMWGTRERQKNTCLNLQRPAPPGDRRYRHGGGWVVGGFSLASEKKRCDPVVWSNNVANTNCFITRALTFWRLWFVYHHCSSDKKKRIHRLSNSFISFLRPVQTLMASQEISHQMCPRPSTAFTLHTHLNLNKKKRSSCATDISSIFAAFPGYWHFPLLTQWYERCAVNKTWEMSAVF